ncbi:DUF1272 domain-containing protein [Aurantivibrio infirmus]
MNSDTDLLASSAEAVIYSFECTFCMYCVNGVLKRHSPNCSGSFQVRPIRPEWLSLNFYHRQNRC